MTECRGVLDVILGVLEVFVGVCCLEKFLYDNVV